MGTDGFIGKIANMKDELLKPWNAEQWLWLFQQPYCDYHMLRKQVYWFSLKENEKSKS